MKIKILSEYCYQKQPIEVCDVEVDDKELSQIGIGKKFDVINNIIINDIDYKDTLVQEQNILRITELKSLLSSTDYQAIKYFEGYLTEEEYAPIKAQRREWRAEINQLEAELNNE